MKGDQLGEIISAVLWFTTIGGLARIRARIKGPKWLTSVLDPFLGKGLVALVVLVLIVQVAHASNAVLAIIAAVLGTAAGLDWLLSEWQDFKARPRTGDGPGNSSGH